MATGETSDRAWPFTRPDAILPPMDPLTHILAAGIASEIVTPRDLEPWALLAATGASVLPDFDYLALRGGHMGLLRFHGTITHSLVGVTAIAIAWGGVVAVALGASWPMLAAFAWLGGLSHVVLDILIHQNGLTLFWPFSSRRLRASLLVGLNPLASPRCGEQKLRVCAGCQARTVAASPVFFLVAATAVAAGLAWPERRAVALTGAAALMVFLLGQFVLKAHARRLSRRAHGPEARVYPASYSGRRWLTARPDDDGWITALVDVLHGSGGPLRVHRPAPADRIRSTQGRPNVQLLTAISVIPFAEAASEGRELWWRDLSYDHDPEVPLNVLKIEFGDDGHVVAEQFRERW